MKSKNVIQSRTPNNNELLILRYQLQLMNDSEYLIRKEDISVETAEDKIILRATSSVKVKLIKEDENGLPAFNLNLVKVEPEEFEIIIHLCGYTDTCPQCGNHEGLEFVDDQGEKKLSCPKCHCLDSLN